MLHYKRIDISEGVDINKTMASKECDICHYFLLNKGFKFQTYVCNRRHNSLMMPLNLCDIAILKIKNVDYRCIVTGISKSEAINLMQNTNLTKNSGTL